MDLKKESPEKLNVFQGFLAHLPGFEPGTFRLGGGRSILLSYKCIFDFGASVDLPLRRRTLYPAELMVHIQFLSRQSASGSELTRVLLGGERSILLSYGEKALS